MKKNDIFLANAVINIVAGAGLVALGIIGAVACARSPKHIAVRRIKR